MKVYKIEALGHTVVFDDLFAAVDEVTSLLENGEDVFIYHEEMTEEEFNALEEHEGY